MPSELTGGKLTQKRSKYESEEVYGCLIHVDIKDGKIWIQYDGTEYAVANELIDRGVPKQDIVLAYHAPYARKYTEFAVS